MMASYQYSGDSAGEKDNGLLGKVSNRDICNEAMRLLSDKSTRTAVKMKAAETMQRLKTYADEGEYSWKVLGLFASIGIMLVSFLSLAGHFFTLSFTKFVLDIYLFAFGACLAVMECKTTFLSEPVLVAIRREALFLYRPYGRAAMYIFVGLLTATIGGWLGFLVGIFSFIIGVVIVNASRSAIKTLDAMRSKLADESDVKSIFQKYSKGSESIDAKQLGALCEELGFKLSIQEVASAMVYLDSVDGNGMISFDEFLNWFYDRDNNSFV